MFRKQPQIEVKQKPHDKKVVVAGWIIIGINFLLGLYVIFDLPDIIPIHFNLAGKADAFGSKNDIWLAPILSLLIYWGLTLITSKVKPWNYNYPIKVSEKNARQLYTLSNRMLYHLNLGIALVFLWLTVHIIASSKGLGSYTSWMFLPLAIFVTLYPFFVIFKMFKIPK